MIRRWLPIGIRTFRELREEDCYYVDKTAYVERLRHEGKQRHRQLRGLLRERVLLLLRGAGVVQRGGSFDPSPLSACFAEADGNYDWSGGGCGEALLEAAYRNAVLGGGLLSPALEVGVRYDGGDAEGGAALVLGGGVQYALAGAGLTLSADGGGLLRAASHRRAARQPPSRCGG